MVGGGAAERYATGGLRDGRLSYVLRAPESRHRFGVTALAVSRGSLFTAGRDGTVREWEVPQSDARVSYRDLADVPRADEARKTFDEHVDWVNDLLLLHSGERLVTCSSDFTVKVWNTAQPRCSLRTLTEHTDYVKALARVPSNGVASASLDGRVLVWDLVRGIVKEQCGGDIEGKGSPSSIYCLSGSSEGDANILVAGSTDRTISVFDIRTGERVVRLRGHSDSVRCVTMKYDCSQMLSGGTDSTVKLWDLRQERCIRSFDSMTSDSVWAIAADRDFDSFVSGGRDGTVWHTSLSGEIASLVVGVADPDKRSNMVLDLALTENNSAVWVSTTGSSVRLWPLPSASAAVVGNGINEKSHGDIGVESTTELPTQNVFGGQRLPIYRISGLPGIVAYKILNNRRHVLTCDAYKEFCIWDIARGKLHKSLGVLESKNIDEVAKEYDEEVSVPSWFTVDIRLGSLAIHMVKKYVFSAEVYAVDADLDVESEDTKVNIGEHVVRGLFANWIERYKQLEEERGQEDGYANGTGDPASEEQAGTNESVRTVPTRGHNLPPYEFPSHIHVIVTEGVSPVPVLNQRVGSFRGNEEDRFPSWVVDLIRDNRAPVRSMDKMAFTLHPVEGSDLPSLTTTTLNAPRVLRVRKVAVYIVKELRDLLPKYEQELEEADIDILCNGQLIPPTMSLATVHHFRWRSPDGLRLRFRRKSSSV